MLKPKDAAKCLRDFCLDQQCPGCLFEAKDGGCRLVDQDPCDWELEDDERPSKKEALEMLDEIEDALLGAGTSWATNRALGHIPRLCKFVGIDRGGKKALTDVLDHYVSDNNERDEDGGKDD